MLQGDPGTGWGADSGPGRGVVGIRVPARGGNGDSGPGRGVGIFLVRWEIFYLFAVFRCLGRDLH